MARIVRFGCFEVDVSAGRLHKRGLRIRLREKSFQVLSCLLEHPGEVVTRGDLRRRLWPDDVFVDFDNNLNTAVARLREALADSSEHPRFVETLPKRGYRFLADVSVIDDESSPHTNLAAAQRAAGAPTDNPAAWDAYVRGRSHLTRATPRDIAEAKRCFEDAIARDPAFALAYDAMGELYWYIGFFALAPPRDACATGIYHALRAMEIDSTLGETHALLGQYRKQLDYNWPEVDREMRRALELNPTSPLVRLRYAVNSLMPHGRTADAVAELEYALARDPASMLVRAWLGVMLQLDGRLDRALEQGRLLIELDPTFFWGHFITAVAYREKRMFDAAIAAHQRAVDCSGQSPNMLGWLGLALAVSGRDADARAVIERIEAAPSGTYVPPTSVAWVYLGLDDRDHAFEWLERAVDARDHMMMPIKSYRFFDRARTDPRYLALLRRMNLAP